MNRRQASAQGGGDRTAGHGFGTAPVFLTSISTILGAIMFLRFGYAVAHVGLWGVLMLIFLGHMITFPTSMAVSEIATNRRVAGGGAYYIISRSFGTTIGGAIGIALYLSQAVSVAFYLVAFAKAFDPVYEWGQQNYAFQMDPRVVSVSTGIIVLGIMIRKGADLGVRALWVVFGTVVASVALFLLGHGPAEIRPEGLNVTATVANPDSFGRVFAICFPAFTGMIAGVGLSGDLRDPKRSIPLGTMSATLVGMAIYVLLVVKLAQNATPTALGEDEFIMSRIALWGPVIPIGLAAASLSSALGSILVAPRTLQALARDRVFPAARINAFLGRGKGSENDPVNATMVSSAIAIVFLILGDINAIAQILTVIFIVTYGALCSISFLEYFAGNPSYRPTFRSRWYVSLLGAVMSFLVMMQTQPLYTFLSVLMMAGIYSGLRYNRRGERDLSAIFQGVMFQLTRHLQIAVQRSRAGTLPKDWRPSFVAITRHTQHRLGHFDLLRWICHRHGFGHLVHYIEGAYSFSAEIEARLIEEKLIHRSEISRAGIFVDTIISPSYETALAQILQLPGISGLPNNSVLFEFDRNHREEIEEFKKGMQLAAGSRFNICVLRSSEHRFGFHENIHIWLTEDDFVNAPLMILLAYIVVGHRDWRKAEIRVFTYLPATALEQATTQWGKIIAEGRLPISQQNLTAVPAEKEPSFKDAVERHSTDADLVILGLTLPKIMEDPAAALTYHSSLNDVLFVNASEHISIS